MGAPELTNCCGVSLKYGTIIIGVVQSIFAFMCMILSAAYVKHPHELVQLNDASVLPQLEILRTMLIIISVASALQCIFSIMLVFGAAARGDRGNALVITNREEYEQKTQDALHLVTYTKLKKAPNRAKLRNINRLIKIS
ncbi:hypothetical protein YQE_04463, partial [Dendroctonus ponderosae]